MQRRDRIVVAMSFLVGAALRLPTTWSRPEHIDEGITLNFIFEMDYGGLLTALPYAQPHFPTYYLGLEAWLDVVGYSAANARLFSVVLGAATVPLIYLVGVELQDRTAGGIAAALTAGSPFYLELSQRIRMYSLWGFLTVAAWLLFLRARRRDWPVRSTAVYLLVAFVLATVHYFGMLTLVAQAGVLAFDRLRERRTPRWVSGGLVAAAAPATAWVALRLAGSSVATRSSGSAAGTVIGTPETSIGRLSELVVQFLAGHYPAHHLPKALVALLAIEVCVLAAAGLWRRCRETQVVVGLWMLVSVLAPLVASLTVKPVLKPRYVVPAALGLYLALGLLVSNVRRPSARGVLAGIVLAGAVFGLPAHYEHTGDRGWIHAGDHLEEHAEHGDKLVTVGFFSAESAYQTRQLDVDVIERTRTVSTVNLDVSCNCSVWVIVDSKSVFGTKESIRAGDLGLEEYHAADVVEVSGRITVYKFSSTNSTAAAGVRRPPR